MSRTPQLLRSLLRTNQTPKTFNAIRALSSIAEISKLLSEKKTMMHFTDLGATAKEAANNLKNKLAENNHVIEKSIKAYSKDAPDKLPLHRDHKDDCLSVILCIKSDHKTQTFFISARNIFNMLTKESQKILSYPCFKDYFGQEIEIFSPKENGTIAIHPDTLNFTNKHLYHAFVMPNYESHYSIAEVHEAVSEFADLLHNIEEKIMAGEKIYDQNGAEVKYDNIILKEGEAAIYHDHLTLHARSALYPKQTTPPKEENERELELWKVRLDQQEENAIGFQR